MATLSAKERAEARARAEKRALRKIDEREHLRLEIQTRAILEEMAQAVQTLRRGYEEIRTPVGDVMEQPLSRERIQAIKAAMDINKTLLDRVLPPLKPVEVRQDEEEVKLPPGIMSDRELQSTLAGYMGIPMDLLEKLN